MPSGNSFYSELAPVTRLADISDPQAYCLAPSDWMVVFSDIRDSTSAVQTGRYKEVNMAAGCIITAVLNSAETRDLPFVFGGDGASLLIPPSSESAVREALIRTQYLIAVEFSLDMRIGLVPISALSTIGAEVRVARLELSPGNNTALFSGGGIEAAEQLVREDVNFTRFAIPPRDRAEAPDLTGLSCRWEPLTSCHGKMLCLLIRPTAKKTSERISTVNAVLQLISSQLGGSLQSCSPVSSENMRFHWPPRGLKTEAKVTRGGHSFLRRYIEVLLSSFIQLVLEKFDLKGGNYNAPVYRQELRINSDYCRFDDVLRIVLDCSEAQIGEIESMLDQQYQSGVIEYGSFQTSQALMTCLVDDLGTSQHVHFIDGDNGGFWSAANDLKMRRKERNKKSLS